MRAILERPEPVVLVVAHVLVLIVGQMAEGHEDAVCTLQGVPYEHAIAYRLSASDLSASRNSQELWNGIS